MKHKIVNLPIILINHNFYLAALSLKNAKNDRFCQSLILY